MSSSEVDSSEVGMLTTVFGEVELAEGSCVVLEGVAESRMSLRLWFDGIVVDSDWSAL